MADRELSPQALTAVSEAALRTTPDYPFLHTMEKQKWTDVRGLILNMVSDGTGKAERGSTG